MTIPTEYNVTDGLLGLGPDILLEILSETKFIQNAVKFLGLCKKTLQLKNHSRFFQIIETLNIQFTIKNPDPESVTFEYVYGILSKANLNWSAERAIGIDPAITYGIYLFEIMYENLTDFNQGPGIVKASYTIPRYCPACGNNDNMICFNSHDGYICYKGQWTKGNSKYSNGQIIGLELDKGKGTLHFFIDSVQQPVFVCGINEPVQFYGHIYTGCASFTIITFKKLPTATSHILPNEKSIYW
ncbi:MAG: hypothetical protein EZS28_021282 [Streblomastix strix]|uniref:B30.2/SPRY domain-containing protein n=1 Tax=Streblomastix strix TaxID=222440 RepID=A0A5J4VKT4_9EUKA|nr:MAG: hypothetical protein EZS28_021282 [Streblomastix strix]